MRRKKLNPRKDRRIFGKTADKTKAVNLTAKGARGGVRL